MENYPTKMGITIDDKILSYHLGDSHPMNSKRIFPAYHLIRELFLDTNEVDIISPIPVDRSLIQKAHNTEYINTLNELSSKGIGTAPEFGLGPGDCPVWSGMREASEFIVSSTVTSAERVYNSDYAIAFELLGGLHHARSARASGFCYYNDINVAIHRLKQLQSDIRIVYIDTDVHHGDGTQFDFYNDPNVLTISFHESGEFIFPGTGFSNEIGVKEGKGHSINLPFYPYTWDDQYIHYFEKVIPPILEAYNPDFVIWQAGVDGHKDDILGHLQLSNNTYYQMARYMRGLVQKMDQPRLISLGGGGYNPFSVAKSWTSIVAGLNGSEMPKYASQEWVELCRSQNIHVESVLVDNPSKSDDNHYSDSIVQSNAQYHEELLKHISPYFSL